MLEENSLTLNNFHNGCYRTKFLKEQKSSQIQVESSENSLIAARPSILHFLNKVSRATYPVKLATSHPHTTQNNHNQENKTRQS